MKNEKSGPVYRHLLLYSIIDLNRDRFIIFDNTSNH